MTDTLQPTITIRDATAQDAEFLAWVMLTAGRSHLERGIWDLVLDRSEEATLDYAAQVTVRGDDHMFHYRRFIIAEVDGQPAAALSGYDPTRQGVEELNQVIVELASDLGWSEEELSASMQRQSVILGVLAEPPQGTWVVESVATAPAFRRRGLVDQLLEVILDRGRQAGHTVAQISVFIGNEPARAAYLKRGFEVGAQARTPEWEAAIGCPGLEHMRQAL